VALIDERPRVAPVTSPPPAEPRGFRPASRRRTRIAAGAVLTAVAIGGNVLVYSGLDDSTEVLQVVGDIRAGDQITGADLRTIEVDVDDSVPVVGPDQIGTVVGRYARTYIASGSLVVPQFLQSAPLVVDGAAVVSVEVRPTDVPAGLRERSRIELVVDEGEGDPLIVEGRVVARPGTEVSSSGRAALSVEVPAAEARRVVSAEGVGIVLLDPGIDPATEPVADQGAGG
jgi:hypothetical protein